MLINPSRRMDKRTQPPCGLFPVSLNFLALCSNDCKGLHFLRQTSSYNQFFFPKYWNNQHSREISQSLGSKKGEKTKALPPADIDPDLPQPQNFNPSCTEKKKKKWVEKREGKGKGKRKIANKQTNVSLLPQWETFLGLHHLYSQMTI